MKLELTKEETEKILLEWAETKWAGIFKSVSIRARYGTLDEVVFLSKEKEVDDE